MDKIIIGEGWFFEESTIIAHHLFPNSRVRAIKIAQDEYFDYSLKELEAIDLKNSSFFVSIDCRFGNTKRMDVVDKIKSNGHHLFNIVVPTEYRNRFDKCGENIFIGNNVTLGSQTNILDNCIIRSNSYIGSGSTLEEACWIDHHVSIGDNCTIKRNSIIRSGCKITNDIKIGKYCDIDDKGKIASDIKDHTTIDLNFENSINFYDFRKN